MENVFKYYAFISYKSEDVEWAIWLQHELEHYHLPSSFNGRSDIQQELRPVFRDLDELSAGNLPKQIEQALFNSKNLIVICSPKSAQSPWVNKEIETFISLGRLDNVFPFIVEGDSPKDFFPKALLELPKDEERLGGDVRISGRDAAFVKIVAGMLGLPFDSLWQRYEKEKAEEERKQREQRDKLLIAQSRFVSEKGKEILESGDSYLARCLCLQILPNDVIKPDRPLCIEAEQLLRSSTESNNAIFKGHTSSAKSSFLTKTHEMLYSLGDDRSLCVWDAKNGMLLHKECIGTEGFGNDMCISHDGKYFATACGHSIQIWNLTVPDLLNCVQKITSPAIINKLAFSVDGKLIFASTDESRIAVWDIQGNLICKIKDNCNKIYPEVEWLSVNRNNRIFASTRESLNIWDFIEDRLVYVGKINIPEGRSSSMKFNFSNDFMINSCKNEVYIWDSTPQINGDNLYSKIYQDNLIHTGEVLATALTNDNRILVGADSQLYIWEFHKLPQRKFGKWDNTTIELNSLIVNIYYDVNHEIAIVSLSNGNVRQIDLSDKKQFVLPIETLSIDFNPNDQTFAVIPTQGIAPYVYNRDFTQLERDKSTDAFNSMYVNNRLNSNNKVVRFSADGNLIYVVGDYINIWNSKTVKLVKHCKKQYGDYSCICMAISRDGERAIYAFKDGRMLLINVNTDSIIKQIEPERKYLDRKAAFSNDSNYILSTSIKGDAKIFDAKNGDLINNLPNPPLYWGNSIEFSQNDEYIISACQNHKVEIWKWDKEKHMAEHYKTLTGQYERFMRASFSSDSSLAVAASPDEIVIWDVKSGKPLNVIHQSGVKLFVAFSPDDKYIFSSDGQYLYVWDFPSLQDLIDETTQRFGDRLLTDDEKNQFYLE